jgi:Zn-dependent protease
MGTYILYKHILAPFSIAPWPLWLVILFFSVVVHEVSHGVMAYKCGDSTAKDMGRITLNPIPHIDIFGTIILPVVLFLLAGVAIAMAKPVPINPNNFKNIKICTIKVGFSGVMANFALAVLLSLIIWGLNALQLYQTRSGIILISVLAAGVSINIFLGLFNLIPIPPLDGSRVVSALLPTHLAAKYNLIEPFGIIIIFITLRFWWALIKPFGNMFYKLLFWGLPL